MRTPPFLRAVFLAYEAEKGSVPLSDAIGRMRPHLVQQPADRHGGGPCDSLCYRQGARHQRFAATRNSHAISRAGQLDAMTTPPWTACQIDAATSSVRNLLGTVCVDVAEECSGHARNSCTRIGSGDPHGLFGR